MRILATACVMMATAAGVAAAAPSGTPAVLTDGGIRLGAAGPLIAFGAARADAMRRATETLGKPRSQRTIADCGQGLPMSEAAFANGVTLSFLRGRFSGWDVDGKSTLRTDRAIGIGATRAAVARAYRGMDVDDGPLGVMFTTAGAVSGFFAADRPATRVVALFAGETCKVS